MPSIPARNSVLAIGAALGSSRIVSLCHRRKVVKITTSATELRNQVVVIVIASASFRLSGSTAGRWGAVSHRNWHHFICTRVCMLMRARRGLPSLEPWVSGFSEAGNRFNRLRLFQRPCRRSGRDVGVAIFLPVVKIAVAI